MDINKGLLAGIIGGFIWGILALSLTLTFGISAREGTLTNNLITFLTGGAILGAVTGGLFSALEKKSPSKTQFYKAQP